MRSQDVPVVSLVPIGPSFRTLIAPMTLLAQWRLCRHLADRRMAAYGQAQVGSRHWQAAKFMTTCAYHQPFTLNQIAGMIALQAINVRP